MAGKKKSVVSIEEHDCLCKDFEFNVGDDFRARVDYDDVNHASVDAMTNAIKTVLDVNSQELMRMYKANMYVQLKKAWDNDDELQEEYPDVDEYIKNRM